jgi:hypothetical protein
VKRVARCKDVTVYGHRSIAKRLSGCPAIVSTRTDHARIHRMKAKPKARLRPSMAFRKSKWSDYGRARNSLSRGSAPHSDTCHLARGWIAVPVSVIRMTVHCGDTFIFPLYDRSSLWRSQNINMHVSVFFPSGFELAPEFAGVKARLG